MKRFIQQKVANFILDESGPTAVEYAVLLALILAVCIAAFASMGSASSNLWSNNSNQMNTYLTN